MKYHPRTFAVSDPHFGHPGICKFTTNEGLPLRPWDDVAQMDEDMVEYWNETVRPEDKVYCLGDMAMRKRTLAIMRRLNGDKVLIKGNHDIEHLKEYVRYFRDVRAYHVLNKVLFSHIPIHPDCQARFRGQVHGHLHSNHIMKDGQRDPWYLNICVEQTNFRPILLDEVFARLEAQQITVACQ